MVNQLFRSDGLVIQHHGISSAENPSMRFQLFIGLRFAAIMLSWTTYFGQCVRILFVYQNESARLSRYGTNNLYSSHQFMHGTCKTCGILYCQFIFLENTGLLSSCLQPRSHPHWPPPSRPKLIPWSCQFSRKMGYFFQWEARNLEKHESAKFWNKVKFCMHLFLFVCSECLDCYA